jgi:phosphoglycerate-specific signal transduction histidine kinase
MVKQGSFFQRLKERWGSGSGVRVEREAIAGEPSPRGDADRAVAARVEPPAVEARSSRKLSDREEAMLALGTHFQELTSLLRGSHARVDDQLGKLVGATNVLAQLPALSQQQLDALRSLSVQMERQNALGEQMATTMTRLPSLLENVEQALARAAATDERTAATVREFQSTMDRIHTSMGQMVQHSEQQARTAHTLAERRDGELKNLAEGMQLAQQRTVHELQRTTEEGLQSLRRTHEDQSNRLQRVVQEHAGWNRAVLFGVALVVLGIAGLVVLQLFQ